MTLLTKIHTYVGNSMKKLLSIIPTLLLFVCCSWCQVQSEKEFQIARAEFKEALEEIIILRAEGKINLQEREDTNKVLLRISRALLVWEESIDHDKINGYEVRSRPDMRKMIKRCLRKLETVRKKFVKRPTNQHSDSHKH